MLWGRAYGMQPFSLGNICKEGGFAVERSSIRQSSSLWTRIDMSLALRDASMSEVLTVFNNSSQLGGDFIQ